MSIQKMSKARALRLHLQAVAWLMETGKLPMDDVPGLLRRVANHMGNRKPVHTGQVRQAVKSDRVREEVIRAALKADPQAPYWAIAARVQCDQARVAEVARKIHHEKAKGESSTPRRLPTHDLPDDFGAMISAFLTRNNDDGADQ